MVDKWARKNKCLVFANPWLNFPLSRLILLKRKLYVKYFELNELRMVRSSFTTCFLEGNEKCSFWISFEEGTFFKSTELNYYRKTRSSLEMATLFLFSHEIDPYLFSFFGLRQEKEFSLDVSFFSFSWRSFDFATRSFSDKR